MQASIKPSQPRTIRIQTQSKERVRTKHRNTGQSQHQRTGNQAQDTTNKLFLTEKKSEQFYMKKNVFQMHTEVNVDRLLLQEKQTGKALGDKKKGKRRKRNKNKTEEKGKRKKNVGSCECTDEDTAVPPFSQAPWKENRASS